MPFNPHFRTPHGVARKPAVASAEHAKGAIALAQRMSALETEGAFDIFRRAKLLEASGRHIAHLEVGEPDFPTAEHVRDAGARALRDGDTRYGAPAGLPELREAIAATTTAQGATGAPIDPAQVLITPGAKPMLLYAALGIVEHGDEVLVPDTGFPIYPSVVRFAGGTPVRYGLIEASGFTLDIDEIAARITPRTKALILNSPHNPTGGIVDRVALDRIAVLAQRHDLVVISDEVYGRIVFDREPLPSLATIDGLRDRTIVVNSFSKTYAMTGWRLGSGIFPAALAERFTTLAVNGHTCVPGFVQRAGLAALTGPQTSVAGMVAEFRTRRDLFVARLSAIPGVSCTVPAGAFYVFPNVSDALAASSTPTSHLADLMLDKFGLALLAGEAFGAAGAGHLRMSFAASRRTLGHASRQLELGIASLGNQAGRQA